MLTSPQNVKLSSNNTEPPISDSFGVDHFSNKSNMQKSLIGLFQQHNVPTRWLNHDHDYFVVAEIEFGIGLHFLALWHEFRSHRKANPDSKTSRLHVISFEKYPYIKPECTDVLAAWPELALLNETLISAFPSPNLGCQRLRFDDGSVVLDLWQGDVDLLLPEVYAQDNGLVDAWFLDSFEPNKNADGWTEALFSHIHRLSRPSATVSTYITTDFVKCGLINAGFAINSVANSVEPHGMLVGHSQKQKINTNNADISSIAIVGGGIASAYLTYLLTQRGYPVELFCADKDVAEGASGNPQGAIYPLLHQPEESLSQFFISAFYFCQQLIDDLHRHSPFQHDWCGVLLKTMDDKSAQKNHELVHAGFPSELIQPHADGMFFPHGGWVVPAELVKTLFQLSAQTGLLTQHKNCEIISLHKSDQLWQLQTKEGITWSASHVVLANGVHALDFDQTSSLPITPMRGQISTLQASDYPAISTHVVCGDGYIVPALNEQQVIGATYVRNDMGRDVRQAEHDENKTKMLRTLPETASKNTADYTITSGRASIRGVTRDHFPLIGGFRSAETLKAASINMPKSGWLPETTSGLFILAGMGSRGLCSAPLAAEIMAALLLNEPLPCSLSTLRNVDPYRRELKRAWKINRGNRRA
jgi:tRNA 5-methylaminomethyl-2-thiouridine biosynthesis bifunctional protein